MTSEDPFTDPLVAAEPAVTEYTLAVGRDATLTLATDSLILLDEDLANRRSLSCCGLSLSQRSIPTRSIPYYNILWAELTPDLNIVVTHACPVPTTGPLRPFAAKSNNVVRVNHIQYTIDKTQHALAQTFVTRLVDRSYGESQRRKRIKVLINPFGGQGLAPKWYNRDIAPIFAAARCELDVVTTRYVGHASEIAEALDLDAWDVVACCSGDGTPHEVFNGLGRRKDAAKALRKIAVVQLPCGSGNAMCINLNGTNSTSLAALGTIKGIRMPMDLLSVTQGDRRFLSFLTQSVGIVAESDLGSDHLRWMGDFRFTWGFLIRLLGKTVYPCDIAIKSIDEDKSSIKAGYVQYLTNAKVTSQSAQPSQKDLLTDDSSSSAASFAKTDDPSDALPPLRYGTIQDSLPQGWEMKPYHNMGNFYAGNMSFVAADTNFFQAALPADGCLDLINMDGDVSRLAALRLLIAAGDGTLFNLEQVFYRKVDAYRIIPHERKGKEGYISIDGERIPFAPFQVEVHRGLGTVLSRTGKSYEAPALA